LSIQTCMTFFPLCSTKVYSKCWSLNIFSCNYKECILEL